MTELMDAALMYGPGDIRVERVGRPAPRSGFVVKVMARWACAVQTSRNLTTDSRKASTHLRP